MNAIPSIAHSGMNAALQRLGAAANNIANAQTPGYHRQFVAQEAQPGGGVLTSVGQADRHGENLAEDLIQQISASYAFKANLRTIQTHDEMLGALLDLHA